MDHAVKSKFALSSLPRVIGLSCCLAVCAPAAFAIDVVAATPPMAISDQKLTIGPRSMTLPDGAWTYAAKSMGAITNQQSNTKAPTYTAYAMKTEGKSMRAGIVLTLPADSVPVAKWNNEPCQPAEGQLLMDKLGSRIDFPECLMVFKREAHLVNPSGDLYRQAKQTADAEGIALMGPGYDIAYFNYATNEFGTLRVFLPAREGQSEQDVITWAKTLPATFAAFFAKRSSAVTFPALP